MAASPVLSLVDALPGGGPGGGVESSKVQRGAVVVQRGCSDGAVRVQRRGGDTRHPSHPGSAWRDLLGLFGKGWLAPKDDDGGQGGYLLRGYLISRSADQPGFVIILAVALAVARA